MSDPDTQSITVRPLRADELSEADHIFRLAFSTARGIEDPTAFMPGGDLVRSRWKREPSAAYAAEYDGRLIGTNFLTNWGSFGYFGPLTIHPAFWGRNAAQALLQQAMAHFNNWGIEHRGLFTQPDSPKHLHLYEKYGFSAGHLTPVMIKPVTPPGELDFQRFSALPGEAREAALSGCADLTNTILQGLDLRQEIVSVTDQGLGETCLLYGENGLSAFAICHCGPGTEGGDDTCFIKFGAARGGGGANNDFQRLLSACELIANEHGLGILKAGVNMGRRQAYRQLIDSGFKSAMIGVAMESLPEKSYNRPDVFIIDDWR